MCGSMLPEVDVFAQRVFAKARELNGSPTTVAVVDAGGAVIVMNAQMAVASSDQM